MPWLFGTLASVLLGPGPAAQGDPITISLEPVSSEIALNGPHDPLVVDILISNPDELEVRSWSVDLCFDPDVFAPLAGTGSPVPPKGFELSDYIPGVVAQWNPLFESNGLAPDVARMGALNMGTTTGSAASGWLGRVALDAVGASPGSMLSFGVESSVLDPNSDPLPVVFEPTEVIVNLPEPATVLLVIAVGALGSRRRRR